MKNIFCFVPLFNPEGTQRFFLENIVSGTASELEYNEDSVFRKDVN